MLWPETTSQEDARCSWRGSSQQLGSGAVWRQGLEGSSYTGGQQAMPSMLGRQVIAPSSLLQ